MFAAFIIVTVLAAAANLYAAANDFTRPRWLLASMTKVGVPESWLTSLGSLKAAGAVGRWLASAYRGLAQPRRLASHCSLLEH